MARKKSVKPLESLELTAAEKSLGKADPKVLYQKGVRTKIQEDTRRRFQFFRRQKKGKAPQYYPLEKRYEDFHRPVLSQKKRESGCEVQQFLEAAERYAFDDPKLIAVIHEIYGQEEAELDRDAINAAHNFAGGELTARLVKRGTVGGTAQRKPDAVTNEYFLKFLDQFEAVIALHGDTLKKHKAFKDIDRVAEQAGIIKRIIGGSTVLPSNVAGKTMKETICLPEEFKANFEERFHQMEFEAVSVYDARSQFLRTLGLDKLVDYCVAVCQFVEFVYSAKRDDNKHLGVLPKTLNSRDGLILDIEGLRHPEEGQNKPIKDARFLTKRTVKDALRDAGILIESDKKISGSFRSEQVYSWREGLKKGELESTLDTAGIAGDSRVEILDSYDKTTFKAWGRILIDTKNRIHLVLAGNSKGKSTLMKSVAEAVHAHAMGRKVMADSAEGSLCDRVFHNFDLKDDLTNGVSKFRAQVRNVVDFFDNATVNSLGLFDELFAGTNSAYLVALAWAVIEEFSKRDLRVMVSTHEQLLENLRRPDGYERMKGKYPIHEGGNISEGQGLDGLTVTSIATDFELQKEPVLDSKAFEVAEEEGLPKNVVARAKELFAHITQNQD